MEKKEIKSIKIGEKDVPLTINGMPNLTYLNKLERDIVKKYTENKKAEKTEITTKELTDLLEQLG